MSMWTFLSSNLKGIEYDKDISVLTVFFINGAVYGYSTVPESVYLEFRDAPSAGKYYAAHVKGKYPSHQIAWPEPKKEAS
jgi:hypothetical protein